MSIMYTSAWPRVILPAFWWPLDQSVWAAGWHRWVQGAWHQTHLAYTSYMFISCDADSTFPTGFSNKLLQHLECKAECRLLISLLSMVIDIDSHKSLELWNDKYLQHLCSSLHSLVDKIANLRRSWKILYSLHRDASASKPLRDRVDSAKKKLAMKTSKSLHQCFTWYQQTQ